MMHFRDIEIHRNIHRRLAQFYMNRTTGMKKNP
jgi:hypothetical protein